MKKKSLAIIMLILVSVLTAGCAYRRDYSKIYATELEEVFGDYTCEALGKLHQNGIVGFDEHSYKAWKITYTDALGAEQSFTLRNDYDFDFAIGRLYEENVWSVLRESLLAECVEAGSVNDTYCSINFDFDLEKYHYSSEGEESVFGEHDYIKEGDYKYFNMADMDVAAFVEDGLVIIQSLRFDARTSYDTPPTDEDIAYFKDVVKQFEEIIPVQKAEYRVQYTDHSSWEQIDLKEENASASEEKIK